MIQLGFGGEVIKAMCLCHAGWFAVRVYAVLPEGEPQELDHVKFRTEQEANEKLPETVKNVAEAFLASVGIMPNLAASVTVTHGDEAIRAEQRLRNGQNPNLH